MSRKDIHFVMPANFAKSCIPAMYALTLQFTESGLFNPSTPAIAQGIRDLLKKVKALSGEGNFKFTFGECALLYSIMVKVKIVFHTVYPKMEQDEREGKLVKQGNFTSQLLIDMQDFIDGIMDDMCETFPQFREEVARFRKSLHNADLEARTMEADNKTIVLRFIMTQEIELRFLHLIFQMFDYMILQSNYSFSESVREAPFFYVTDYKEVYEKVETAAIGNIMSIDFTLRDVIVVYIVSNLTQKLYFTDAGDDFMAIFDKVSAGAANGISGVELRNLYLQLAARINEVIEEKVEDETAFTRLVKPVTEFMI